MSTGMPFERPGLQLPSMSTTVWDGSITAERQRLVMEFGHALLSSGVIDLSFSGSDVSTPCPFDTHLVTR